MLPSALKLVAVSATLLSFIPSVYSLPQDAIQSAVSTVSAAIAGSTSASAASGTTACNNSPSLCNSAYNDVTFMGAHDAAFVRDSTSGFSVSGNQFFNATVALSAGVRLIQAQVHNSNGVLELCHTSCVLLDAGPLEDFLSEIKIWMDANPNEVVTLLLVNSDNKSAATFGSVFTSSRLSKYGYTPTTNGPMTTWPTLQTMISANTRLVTFIASITPDTSYPYLLPEFSYVFETAFGVSSLSGFNCTLQRPTTLSSASSAVSSGYLGLINHFADTTELLGSISVPDVDDIETTNSDSTTTTGALGTQASQCQSEWGKKPNFILVDFWNVGPAIDTADKLNGITPTGRKTVSTAELTSASGAGRLGRSVWVGVLGLVAAALVPILCL